MLKSSLPDIPKSAHFIGIGGAGMSGIALVLHERGCKVTGSDLKESNYVRKLRDAGIEVFVGHQAHTINEVNPEVVVCSTAIPETNPEMIRARELNLEVWPRAKMLSALSKGFTTIAIAGTHGKTTTSSMCASMLDNMGEEPSFLIGGIVEQYNTNGKSGKGNLFVAEADESDGSFLYLAPDIVVVTNIEADHLDHYGTLENIEKTFVRFMNSVGEDGHVIICAENPHIVDLAHESGRKVHTYGFAEGCDYRIIELKANHGLESKFAIEHGGEVHEITLHTNPGVHNMLNATASFAVADILGLDDNKAAQALSEFKGVRRRFTHIADCKGACIVDDYGHHPTEIKATIKAATSLGFNRVVVCFQPHRYSRTESLLHEFATAFEGADKLYIMDVFAAGEIPIPGVSGKTLARTIADEGQHPDVEFIGSRKELISRVAQDLKEGDLFITMGAGDVTQIGPNIVDFIGE